ncbi:hypothetical protein Cni_G23061 [Canna indica]|uniref:Uncharacterized protein n=1 Tax=Canna indica TaxID=4628 RepID=A0AAQ3QM36_9LILI|nr:hypothetical protein Cni_G23061 [Canna indica]
MLKTFLAALAFRVEKDLELSEPKALQEPKLGPETTWEDIIPFKLRSGKDLTSFFMPTIIRNSKKPKRQKAKTKEMSTPQKKTSHQKREKNPKVKYQARKPSKQKTKPRPRLGKQKAKAATEIKIPKNSEEKRQKKKHKTEEKSKGKTGRK